MQETKQIEGKVNMVWDYYSEVASAPDRTEVTMDGVNCFTCILPSKYKW